MEQRIERAYRQSVAASAYRSISVINLCNQVGISRKMFYRHFKGKDDVLRHIFDRDVVAPQVELCRLLSFEKMASFAPEMELHMFQAIYDDGSFYRDVVESTSGGEDAFIGVAAAAFDKFNRIMLHEYGFKGAEGEVDYIAAYFAMGKAQMIAKWVREGYPLSPEEASGLYARMVLPFWSDII